MSWTLITSGGKGKESPFYREFLITSASDLQNEPDMSIATGSIACIVGSGLAMAHKYMKGQSGQWTEIPADVFDVQINGTSITNNGVANIPIATTTNLGVVKFNNSYSIGKDEYGNVVGIPNSYSEYLSALPQSIVSKGTLDNVIDNNNNKLIAISNAKEIDITIEKDTLNVYEQFIIENNLEDETVYKNIATIVEASSTKYYTTWSDVIEDINAGTTTHSTTVESGAYFIMHKNNNITVIKLLQNYTINVFKTVTNPFFLDLNGFELNDDLQNGGIAALGNTFLGLYGVKENSKLKLTVSEETTYTSGFFIHSKDSILWAIGFNSETVMNKTSSSFEGLFYMFVGRGSDVFFKNITYTYISNDNRIIKCPFYFVPSSTRNRLKNIEKFINCNITTSWAHESEYVIRPPIMEIGAPNTYSTTIIDNCVISHNQISYTGQDDGNVEWAIWFSGGTLSQSSKKVLIIKNSHLKGTNNAYQVNVESYIYNSILEGSIHGGIYASDNTNKTYVKDCILRQTQNTCTGVSPNPYACYIGYDANIYFDNCKFESIISSNNARPAIKTGDSSGITHRNTKAYFSNCEMNSIRVDQYCVAYMGLGMLDSLKQQSVNGMIVDSGRTTYSYRLLENELIDGNLSNKEV